MKRPTKILSFYETVTAAVNDITEHGYDTQERVDFWLREIAAAAARDLTPEHSMRETLNRSIALVYKRLVDNGGIVQYNPGVSRLTIDRVKPMLRGELDRRIMASANLIKLNRKAAIEKTLQRFSGWSTSIPKGGSAVVDKRDVKDNIRKSLAQLPYEERRVLIDQGHKFTAALSEVLAVNSDAIAGEWHSHWKQLNYNYREDHKERDLKIYAVRGNWAMQKGLMKAGDAGFTDEITRAGEEVSCRCFYRWIYNLRDLPQDMLTLKGKSELARIRAAAGI